MARIAPPTTSLPPLRRLAGHSVADVAKNLRNISQLYWPAPRTLPPQLSLPTRRFGRPLQTRLPDSGYASAAVSDDECDSEEITDGYKSDSSDYIDELRADPVERAFAIRWITGLLCRINELSLDDDDDIPNVDADEARERLLEQATDLLAKFSRQEDGADEYDITRTFEFPSNGGETIGIELNDAPLSNSDHTSVGLQSWGCAIILAERLCADPPSFDLVDARPPLRILELGAGTGLLSIAAAKLLPHATVVATDYHPATLANLAINLRANFATSPPETRITAHELDWARPTSHAPFDVPFDVVLAADVVYHPDHARWIRGCVARVLRPPPRSKSASEDVADVGGMFHMMVAVRTSGRHDGMDRTVEEAFAPEAAEDGVPGYRLAVLDHKVLGRQRLRRADETGYRLFKIGWVSNT